jgi:16S rRNA processing protein RimM
VRLTVARIGRAHGIRGEVTVQVRTDVPERRFVPGAEFFAAPATARTPGLPSRLVLESVRDHNGVLLLAFVGVADRNAAEALRGVLLEADVEDDAEDDAWFDHHLVGLAAVDPAGRALGEVVAVEHPGAQDRLVVRRPNGVQRLVPFVTAIVPEVDVAGGRVVIAAPPGLLEDLPDDEA